MLAQSQQKNEFIAALVFIHKVGCLNTLVDFEKISASFSFPLQAFTRSQLSQESQGYVNIQQTITYSKSVIETLEKGVKYVQS